VYKVGTRARKAQADLVQGGRSMIEMLGVLAIIGVLSVGGIAGYSKAMTKFKINKTINQVSQISANVRTLYASQDSYEGLNQAIVKKAKLAPDEVFAGNTFSAYSIHSKVSGASSDLKNDTNMTNPFGGGLWVGIEWTSYFTIVYTGIPEDACVELVTQDWGQSTQGLTGISLGIISHAAFMKNCGNPDDAFDSFPISVSDAAKVCNGNDNMLAFAFE
jgi:Tfp pilus assembly protein PilE